LNNLFINVDDDGDDDVMVINNNNNNDNNNNTNNNSNYNNNNNNNLCLQPGMVTAPPTTADGSRPQTTSGPIVEVKPPKIRPGLNVYHPKPIPPPEVLPLTRTVGPNDFL